MTFVLLQSQCVHFRVSFSQSMNRSRALKSHSKLRAAIRLETIQVLRIWCIAGHKQKPSLQQRSDIMTFVLLQSQCDHFRIYLFPLFHGWLGHPQYSRSLRNIKENYRNFIYKILIILSYSFTVFIKQVFRKSSGNHQEFVKQ